MRWLLSVALEGIVQLHLTTMISQLDQLRKSVPVESFGVEETVTVFVLENSEKWQLKNLCIFLKQTGTRPTNIVVLLIACFIPTKRNSSVKAISVCADNDFSPLKTCAVAAVICLSKTLTRTKTGCTLLRTTNRTMGVISYILVCVYMYVWVYVCMYVCIYK